MSYYSRLTHAFDKAPILPLTSASRYVLISDCHRGDGSSNDNFLKNQDLYFTALSHYYNHGFTYIELGDGDELWENHSMSQIIEIHSDVFQLLSLFYKQKRLFMIYGNHDMEKKKCNYSNNTCSSYYCSDAQCTKTLFPDLPFYEGIILENLSCEYRIYLTHGHQADFFNSTVWKLTRFLVRYFWRPLEHFGIADPTSAAKNYTRKDRIEKKLSSYAIQNQLFLITGHTHRPRLNSEAPYYMNTGSCVHPRSITCIEIENKTITLVKWLFDVKKDRTLYVTRKVLSQNPLPYLSS